MSATAPATPAGLSPIEQEALRAVTPSAGEETELQQAAATLVAQARDAMAAAGLAGTPAVQGSVAKGTWLRGGADIDLFLLLDPAVPAARLEGAAEAVGQAVLRDARRKYAQHPYLTGTFNGHQVDVVPAYAVAEAGARMSAVDRTPFHTAWVRATLDESGRQQVRLAKKWLKGIGAYGAQTAVGGFSGYLVEVLVARFHTFQGLVAWLAEGAQPRRIALGVDQAKDEVAPLVVVDPVDPARNCAAAVSPDTLDLAVAAAQAYVAAPTPRFFDPRPAAPAQPQALHSALSRQGSLWAGAILRPLSDRMDIVYPQFQRAGRTLAGGLRHAGFTLRRLDTALSPAEDEVLLQWITDGPLPATRLQTGPPTAAAPNAQQFRGKWDGHPEARGPVHERDGRLCVEVANRIRAPAQWLAERLGKEALGKHAEAAARQAIVLDDPAQVPPAWAPHVADTVLGRRPWER